MKPKTLILLVVAASCGLVASYMTSKLLAERKAPPPEETVQVVVALTKVPKYTHLKDPEKFFTVKEFRKSDAPKSYFSQIEDIKGKRVNKEFKADVHISPEDVQDRLTTSLPIPDGGYGAIAIRVNQASAVSFFVSPGDRVDIVLTEKGEKPRSSTFLRDVLVLSVADRIVRENADPNSGGSTIQAQTVSVALKPDEIQLVRLAESVGELTLVLRKEGDKMEAVRPVTYDDLQRAAGVVRQDRVVTTQPPTTPGEQPRDPNKLPFGLELDKIPKGDRKEDVEVGSVPKPPVHKLVIESGISAPQTVYYYEQSDGSIGREPSFTEPKKVEKK